MASNLEYTLGLEVGKAISALRSFQNALGQSQPNVEKLRGSIQGVERTATSTGGRLLEMGNSLKTALAGAAAAIGAFEGLRLATDQFKKSIEEAASFEQIKVGFTVLLQSGQKAKDMLAGLSAFADTTPFRMPELAQAARTLLAFGEPAKDVMNDLRRLGDVAAGVQAPIGEIAELFGKARSEGTLFSIDIRELTRRGIPIIGELAKQFHVSENAVRDLAETGRIKFADLQAALVNLTSRGGMFAGMIRAQGATFNGMISTMQDALGALYREFGTPLLDPLKAGVGAITAILAGWKTTAQEWGATLSNALKGALAIVQNGDAGAAFGAALQLGIAKSVNLLYKGAMGTVAALATGLAAGAGVLIQAISKPAVWKTLADGMNYVGAKLAVAVSRALADALAEVPGMSSVALGLNKAANQANTDANKSEDAVRDDLKNTDVQEVARNAAAATSVTADVFKAGFAGAHNVMDEDKPAAALAGTIQKANATNNPLPIYYDNEGNPYGAGAPFGSPDSQMPKPGTPASRPTASDLGPAWRAFIQGQLPTPEPDPGPGTINGQPAAGVLGPGRPTLPGRPGALTLPGPRASLAQPIPNLNARAEAAVGGAYARPDPNTALTAANTKDIAATLKRLLDTVQRSDRTPAGVFT